MRVKLPNLHAFAFLVVVSASAAYSQIPPWALSHQHARYQPETYLLGVGSAAGEKANVAARRRAQSDIASRVRAMVQSELKNIQRTYGLSREQDSYADFKIKSISIVDEELPDADIIETSFDSSTKTTYVLAALNKDEFSRSLADQLIAGWDRAMNFRRASEDLLRQGKVAEGIQNLFQARAVVMDLLPLQALHDALARSPYSSIPSLSPSALTSILRETLSGVRIEKTGGDKQKGRVGENFPEPFIVQVNEFIGTRPVPAVGAEIVFTNSSGDPFGRAVTDSKGTASCVIKVKGNIGHKIQVRLLLPSLGPEFSSVIDASSAAFDCTLLEADVAFSLKVEVRSSEENDAIRSLVTDAVTRAGYHIVDMSRFELRAGFLTASPTTVDSADGSFTFVSADLSVTLIDKSSNRILGSIDSKSQGVAKSQEEALKLAARGAKLDGAELAALLEKARN